MTDPRPHTVIDLGQLDHDGRFANHRDAGDVARALLALDAGRMGSWSHDIVNDEVWGDRLVARLLNFKFEEQPWTADDFFRAIHPEDIAAVSQSVEDAYSGKHPFYDVIVRTNPSEAETKAGIVRWVGARGQVTQRDADGNALQVIGVNWDATKEKQHEQSLAMLASEMDHRVKNAFAVIRALINIGAEATTSKANFAGTLRSQVEAMATAHTLSAQIARRDKNASAAVALSEVLDTALAPWIEIGEGSQTRVTINCDPTITLPPNKIAAFAMMIYELSTNATKYGPLGEIGGAVDVSVLRTNNGGLTMVWHETVPIQPVPLHDTGDAPGFGQVLLDHCANTLDAQMTRKLTSHGFQLYLDIRPPVKA